MPYFIISGGKNHDFWSEIKYFHSKPNLKEHLEGLGKNDKADFIKKVESYFELIVLFCNNYGISSYNEDIKNFMQLISANSENIEKEFSNEIPRSESEIDSFVKKVIEKLDQIFEQSEIDDAINDSKGVGFFKEKNNWENEGENEVNKWDRETGGSWRFENDFG